MSEWISVKDMLPEPGLYVLAARRVNSETHLEVGFLSDRGKWIVAFGLITDYVTHWMPLPEPPKER